MVFMVPNIVVCNEPWTDVKVQEGHNKRGRIRSVRLEEQGKCLVSRVKEPLFMGSRDRQ